MCKIPLICYFQKNLVRKKDVFLRYCVHKEIIKTKADFLLHFVYTENEWGQHGVFRLPFPSWSIQAEQRNSIFNFRFIFSHKEFIKGSLHFFTLFFK